MKRYKSTAVEVNRFLNYDTESDGTGILYKEGQTITAEQSNIQWMRRI